MLAETKKENENISGQYHNDDNQFIANPSFDFEREGSRNTQNNKLQEQFNASGDSLVGNDERKFVIPSFCKRGVCRVHLRKSDK